MSGWLEASVGAIGAAAMRRSTSEPTAPAPAGTSSDRDTVFVTGAPTRSGIGMIGQANVTNTLTATTLAPATLSGNRVNVTATDGDITLAGARINANESASLNATNGAVNFGVVVTGTEVSQTSGMSDLAYQRTRDSGVNAEAANYTQIDTPNLAINTPQVNVQVGQNVAYQGANAPYGIPTQTVAQALAAQANQPGMQWLTQVQTNAQLNNLQLNWQGVPLEQRQWAEAQSGLTPAGAAIVTIVASVLTWGAAGAAGGAVASGVGATGATATVISVAVQAGIANLAGQASVSLINNNGDMGAVMHELGSSHAVHSLLTSMVTAGAIQGLNGALGIEAWTPNNVGQAVGDTQVGWGNVLARNLVDRSAAAVIGTAINGGDLERNLATALANGLIDTGAATSANVIGATTRNEALASAVAHAIAGCAAGAGRASASGAGLSSGAGCSAGAIGAVVGEMTARIYNPSSDPALTEQTVQLSQMLAGIAGAVVTGGQAGADIAAAAGANAAANNWLSGSQRARRDAEIAACGKDLACQVDRSRYWANIDRQQQQLVDRLSAARDSVTLNPSPENLRELSAAVRDTASLRQQFVDAGDTNGARTLGAMVLSGIITRAQGCSEAGRDACGQTAYSASESAAITQAMIEIGLASEATISSSNLVRLQNAVEALASPGATSSAVAEALGNAAGAIRRALSNWGATSSTGRTAGEITIVPGAKPDANEIRAGQGLAAQYGYDVTHQPTASQLGIQGQRTADLTVKGVGQVDVYTPTAFNPNAITRAIESKNSQAEGVLVQANLTEVDMAAIAARIWGKPTAQNIQTIFFQKPDGSIARYNR